MKLRELVDFLSAKYGKFAVNETGSLATWKDSSGNVLNLQVAGEAFRYKDKEYALIGGCTIIYYHGKLRDRWEEKVAEWVERRKTCGHVGKESF